jgi:hypothetical protein
MHFQKSAYRPFEILKVLRQGKTLSYERLRAIYRNSEDLSRLRWFVLGLQRHGLIEVDTQGEIKATERFDDLHASLGVSLQQLSDYTKDSIVCSPVFGPPAEIPASPEVFVLMPFIDTLLAVYVDHIRKAAEQLGHTVGRADDFYGPGHVMSEVWTHLNRAAVVIADCTSRNPNVFYEIGIAHTLGRPVILISQDREDIPFNIRDNRVLIYEYTPRGMLSFERALTAAIETAFSHSRTLEELLAEEGNDN